MDNSLTLYELNEMVRFAVKKTLPDSYWVKAEINEMRIGSGGHCYVEFVENSELKNIPVAKARGIVWGNIYKIISQKFEDVTNMSISVGLKVLVNVTVEFHEIYGFSLNVIDIDPGYTIGELFLRRKEIIRRLELDGVIDMNKEVEFPMVPQRIAVISSSTAAGYGDFKEHLKNNPYNMAFDLTLFPSIMQGEYVESSIISSLDMIFKRKDDFDVVVIIRGGGASSDLTGFDTYNLAYHCAQFPLPIISGIGHERDKTVLDYVANVTVKTPTAAAQYIITKSLQFAEMIESYAASIGQRISSLITQEKIHLNQLAFNWENYISKHILNGKNEIENLYIRLKTRILNILSKENNSLLLFSEKLPTASLGVIVAEKHKLYNYKLILCYKLKEYVKEEKYSFDIYRHMIKNNDPKKIMEKGYVVMRANGKSVRYMKDIVFGDKYNLEIVDGKIDIILNKA